MTRRPPKGLRQSPYTLIKDKERSKSVNQFRFS